MSSGQKQAESNDDFQVALAIIGAGVTNAVTLLQITAPFSLWNTVVGIILLCILQAYVPSTSVSRSLHAAYAATWSFTLITTGGVLFDAIFKRFHPGYGANWFPWNGYDIAFVVLWGIIFGIKFLILRRTGKGTPSPQHNAAEAETQIPSVNTGEVPATAAPIVEKKS